jgi:hypothetical protein
MADIRVIIASDLTDAQYIADSQDKEPIFEEIGLDKEEWGQFTVIFAVWHSEDGLFEYWGYSGLTYAVPSAAALYNLRDYAFEVWDNQV